MIPTTIRDGKGPNGGRPSGEAADMAGRPRSAREVPALDTQVLADLLDCRVPLVVVRSFTPPVVCTQIAEYLRSQCEPRPYTHEIYEDGQVKYLYFGVDRVGEPFNYTFTHWDRAAAQQHYYDNALPGIRRLRAAAAPYLSPIDRLRVELDELWPAGATVASFKGRKMFVGIARVMQADRSHASHESPHFDALPPAICPLDGQLAANIFIAVPPTGGELEVWGAPPLPPEAVLPDNWRDIGGDPIVVKPEVGDLLLFNSRRPHATTPFASGDRISLQCFIGYRRDGALLFWN